MVDPAEPRITEQLRRSKHPLRAAAGALPSSLDHYGDCGPPLKRELRSALCALRRFAGVGPDGARNEFWRVLGAANFRKTPRADNAMGPIGEFANMHVAAELPAWFYAAFSEVRLVAAVKPGGDAAMPDARPVAPGFTMRRAIEHAAIQCRPHQAGARENHFWQLNVGCAIPGGISVLSLGFSMLMFKRPALTYIKVDYADAHNRIKRCKMAKVFRVFRKAAYDAGGEIRKLVPLLWAATLSAKSAIILADKAHTRAPFDSEEGGQ